MVHIEKEVMRKETSLYYGELEAFLVDRQATQNYISCNHELVKGVQVKYSVGPRSDVYVPVRSDSEVPMPVLLPLFIILISFPDPSRTDHPYAYVLPQDTS